MHYDIVPRIVSIEPSENGKNRIKSLWQYFQSFESFTKITILTSLLIILSTPFIVRNRQIFNPKAQESQGIDVSSSRTPEFLSNQLLVKVKKEVKDKVKEGNPQDTGIPSLNAINKEHKVKSFEKIAKKGENSDANHDLFSWYKITLDAPQEILTGNLNHALGVIQTNPSNINVNQNDKERRGILSPAIITIQTLQQLITKLKSDPNIEDVDLNYIVHTTAIPNDPYYSSTGSWGQSYPDLWGMKKINAESAWDQATGSAGIVVASIDTGVDRNHEDLAANMWTNPNEIPNNGIDDDKNGYIDDYYGWDWYNNDNDPMDDNGHGTHTAGTIGAVGNNGIGVVGVNWTSKIMALKFCNSSASCPTDKAVKALQYAADMGAKVSSNSWGGVFQNSALADAVKYEHDKGMVIVAGAGNNNGDALDFSPASSDYAITVAASDPTDLKASFSNWGEKIDVAAPGVEILSTRTSVNPTCAPASETVGPKYCRMNGTSMATPHVAGLAALLLAKNPTLTNEELRQIIRNGADDLGIPGKDSSFGYGRINATGSMNLSTTHPLTPTITSPGSRVLLTSTTQIIGSVPGPNFKSYKVEVGIGRQPTSWTTLADSTTQVINGVLTTVDPKTLPEGLDIIRLTATDTANKIYQFQIYDIEVDNIDAVISSPSDQALSGSVVKVVGTALTKNGVPFANYKLEWGAGASPSSWSTTGITLTNGGVQPVSNGNLGTWDTSSLSLNQEYSLRLTVNSNAAYQTATNDVVVSSTVYNLVLKLGSPLFGSGDGQFWHPYGVATDSSGNFYVIDTYNGRVQKFTSSGNFLLMWGWGVKTGAAVFETCTSGCQAGFFGSGDGQFYYPFGIATDSSNNVYVVDSYNNRIQKFTSEGVFITKWGVFGSGDGQFWYPYGVATDSNGNVYVADTNNHRIQKFTSAGVFITKWGVAGSGVGQFYYPDGIAVDSINNVYVADSDNNRIQKFTSTGVFITKWGTYGTGDGQFNSPYGVATDSSGNVYVADTGNSRIQKFSPIRTPPCDSIGDVDFDGVVSSSDFTVVQTLLGHTVTTEQERRADVDGNNFINIFDITAIYNYISGTQDSFPICSVTPTPTPTPLPTATPTPTPTSANAVYDTTLKAPKCAGVISSCDSTTLLNGRNGIGPEPNAPNTINSSCADGTSGTYHVDESLDKLKVSTTDGSAFASGKTAKIEATVWVWGASQDSLDLYYTDNANSPSWTFLTTLKASATGSQVLSTTYTLPSGSLQAIRGNFRYLGSASSCSTGGYDDHDDLIFETGSVTSTPTPTPTGVLPTSTPTPIPTSTPTPTPSDTIKPTVSITSPLNGATVAKKSTVTIAATASDNVSVTKVEFYVSGTLKCTDTTSPYSCAWNVPNSPGKTYQLQAKAYDAAGNVGSSSVVTVTSN